MKIWVDVRIVVLAAQQQRSRQTFEAMSSKESSHAAHGAVVTVAILSQAERYREEYNSVVDGGRNRGYSIPERCWRL